MLTTVSMYAVRCARRAMCERTAPSLRQNSGAQCSAQARYFTWSGTRRTISGTMSSSRRRKGTFNAIHCPKYLSFVMETISAAMTFSPKVFKFHCEGLQVLHLPALQVGLPDVLQDASFGVHLPQIFEEGHLATPLCLLVELDIGGLPIHVWVGRYDGHHRATHEEHGVALARQEKPHFGLTWMEGEEHPSGRAVPATGIIHELLARAVAELRQVRGRVLQHETGAALDLEVLMTFQHVQNLRDVAPHTQTLVQSGVVQEHSVCGRVEGALAEVLRPAAAGTARLPIEHIAAERVPDVWHGSAYLVLKLHAGYALGEDEAM